MEAEDRQPQDRALEKEGLVSAVSEISEPEYLNVTDMISDLACSFLSNNSSTSAHPKSSSQTGELS